MPPSKWETWFKWLVVAALAIVVINLFAASTMHAQQITYVDSLGYDGITICDSARNVPVIKIQINQPPLGLRLTILHEMVHFRQFLNYPGGCMAMQKRYSEDTRFRIATEIEAYCSAIDFEPALKVRESMMDDLASQLFAGTGHKEVPLSEVLRMVHERCNAMRGGESKPPPAPS